MKFIQLILFHIHQFLTFYLFPFHKKRIWKYYQHLLPFYDVEFIPDDKSNTLGFYSGFEKDKAFDCYRAYDNYGPRTEYFLESGIFQLKKNNKVIKSYHYFPKKNNC